MAKIIDEFKAFALKGNVVDMAVGVIIGGAFGKIVSSVVADLIMPLIAVIGGVNTSDLKLTLKPGVDAVLDATARVLLRLCPESACQTGPSLELSCRLEAGGCAVRASPGRLGSLAEPQRRGTSP